MLVCSCLCVLLGLFIVYLYVCIVCVGGVVVCVCVGCHSSREGLAAAQRSLGGKADVNTAESVFFWSLGKLWA